MYHEGMSYQTISNVLNEEKLLNKTNWRDSTIFNILTNEIYKGDFVHGKRTKKSTYYNDVVEPLVIKKVLGIMPSSKEKESEKFSKKIILSIYAKIKMS